MSKKQEQIILPLPKTSAETAEKRLEEIINNKSSKEFYAIFEHKEYSYFSSRDGEARLYPDGFEIVRGNTEQKEGALYVDRRRLIVYYSLDKEYEKQGKAGE